MSEARTTKLAIAVSERDHVIGPTDAPVTVVNYGDYECPGCSKRHRQIQQLADELLNRVQLVQRHFPLINVHPHSLRAAEAAEVAAAQGKFWEMHRRLYSNPDKLEDRNLRRYAQEIGLDLDRYDREMGESTYASQILKDYYDSMINGITGAPSTFINGVLYPMGGVELVAAVKKILKESAPL